MKINALSYVAEANFGNIIMVKCERCTSPLWPNTIQEDYVYEGETHTVDVDYSVCGFCGYEVITTEQIKINDERLRKVWKQADSKK